MMTIPKTFDYCRTRPVQFDGPIAQVVGAESISFDDIIKRYDVTPDQLKADMKQLRWRLIGKTYFFDLKDIRARYQVDSYKLETLAKLQAVQKL